MSPEAFGFLSALPLAFFFVVQAARLRARMDAQAHRRLRLRSASFLGACAVSSAVLYAWAGAVPLPFAWTALLAVVLVALLLGLLKRG